MRDDPGMKHPFLLAQLSDPHIGAEWGYGDPTSGLAATVESVRSMRPQPDAVLVSGDLADHGGDSEYARVRELLAPLQRPIYVLPGNHDDRRALRRGFGLAGDGAEPVQYAVELGPLRLVVLDSTHPGEDPGALDSERLAWLDAELAAAPERPTMIAMHHPPLVTGIPVWDAIALPSADRRMLADVVARHQQVQQVVAGHVHRTIAGELAGRRVLAAPSTFVQARLDFGATRIEFTSDPPAFAVHAILDGELATYVQPVS